MEDTKYMIKAKYDAKDKRLKKAEKAGMVVGLAILAGSVAYELGQVATSILTSRIPVVAQYKEERNSLDFLRAKVDYNPHVTDFAAEYGSNYAPEVQAKLDLVRVAEQAKADLIRAADSERKSKLQEAIKVGEERLVSLRESHPSEVDMYIRTENNNSLWGFGLGGLVLVLTGMGGLIKRDINQREKEEELAKVEDRIIVNAQPIVEEC